MIRSEKDFDKRAKELIQMILDGKDISNPSEEDRYIISECIKEGYLVSKFLAPSENGTRIFELMDKNPVTKKGLHFASPKRNWIAVVTMVATIITAIGVFKTELISLISSIVKLI